MTQLQVNQFSHGLLNPGLGWLLSCLGSFIGLRCLTRARAYTGRARASWLLIASVAVGGTGIWAMHFVAMLGYTIPGQEILYNVPMTVISLVAAISVVAVGYGFKVPIRSRISLRPLPANRTNRSLLVFCEDCGPKHPLSGVCWPTILLPSLSGLASGALALRGSTVWQGIRDSKS